MISLRTKILAIVLPGLLFSLALLFAVFEYIYWTDAREDMSARLQRFVEVNSAVLSESVWTYNFDRTQQVLQVLAQAPDFLAAAVYDMDGTPVALVGDETDLNRSDVLMNSRVLTHIDSGGGPAGGVYRVGSLIVAFSLDGLKEALLSRLRTDVAAMILVMVVLSLLTTLTLSRLLHRPLMLFVSSLERGRREGAYIPVNWHSKDELGLVVRAYNDMLEHRKEAEGEREQLIELGKRMASESSTRHLLEMILTAAKGVFNADGGTVYIADRKAGLLHYGVIINDTMAIKLGGRSDKEIPFPPISMRGADGLPNHGNVATHVALTGAVINIADVYEEPRFDFQGPKRFDEEYGYRSKSFLVIPLKNRHDEVVGVLQLINARNADNEVIPFPEHKEDYVAAMANQAGVALENSLLIQTQQELMDSFIKLIAGAIDAKSPYTGGHCERVPRLATMLAEAACEAGHGPFADFAFTSEREWREFHIGAWLHDCGKVTTPEYVVDKATKLETIYNRIHEIRMRFEVLWRDAEIEFYQEMATGAHDPAMLEQALEEVRAQLREDFAFVAECNVGGEFMSDDKIDRLKQIGALKWTRHFDDRLGLSHMEEARLAGFEKPVLPVEETLLADKAEHVLPREGRDANPFGDNPFGFRMEVPPALTNMGEIYNLSIRKGTLTDEERFKINDHIVQTIKMLGELPFPSDLERVPEYAGSHHETMVGTGYPRKLTREEMSIPARIMAIADIFEALTASDRPYKKAKTLSEAIKIMSFMKKDEHIDPDLFDLFLRSGVYRDYAETYLDESQIDEVDVTQYLAADFRDRAPS